MGNELVDSADGLLTGEAVAAAGVPTTRTLTAGNGLTGGGDLSADRTFDVVANADGSILANANDVQVGVLATDAQHGNRGGGGIHAAATTAVAGFMVATDKVKVNSIAQMVLPPPELADRPFHYVTPVPLAGGTLQQIGMNANFQGGTAFQGLAAGDLRTMSNRSLSTRNNVANSNCGGPYSAGLPQLVIGAAGQGGGFHMVGRFAYPFFPNDGVFFFGASPAVRAGGAAASGANNTLCIGADTGDANLTVISRNNAGAVTKSAAIMTKAALTTGDPTTNGARVIDFGLQCLPNGGVVTAWVYDVSNGAYILAPTPVTLTLPLAGTALHISGAASTVGNVGRLDQEFMHFFGWW